MSISRGAVERQRAEAAEKLRKAVEKERPARDRVLDLFAKEEDFLTEDEIRQRLYAVPHPGVSIAVALVSQAFAPDKKLPNSVMGDMGLRTTLETLVRERLLDEHLEHGRRHFGRVRKT